MPINGRINLGLNGISYFGGFFPFINIWKSAANLEINTPTGAAGANQQWLSTTAKGKVLSPWGVYMNEADGELINPIPTAITSVNRIFSATNDFIGQAWVIKFDGTATTFSIAGATGTVRVGNRITWTWNTSGNLFVSISGINVNDPPRNIRICKASHEAALDAGEIFNPDWISDIQDGAGGVVRFMDWASTNHNRAQVSFDAYPSEAFFRYGGVDPGTANLPSGFPLSVMVAMCQKVNSHGWYNFPHVFGCLKGGTVTAITQANPPVVTDLGHSYVNGEEIIIHQTGFMIKTATVTFDTATDLVNWTGHGLPVHSRVTFSGGTLPTPLTGSPYFIIASGYGANSFKIATIRGGPAIDLGGSPSGTTTGRHGITRNRFTIQNVVAGTSYELVGLDTSGHSVFSGTAFSTRPVNLTDMTTEITKIATYFRDNMPAGLKMFYEFSNEVWNSIFGQFDWTASQSGDYFAAEGSYHMTGYLAAHCMATVRDVYNDRSRWVGVLATQASIASVSSNMILGVNQYITDHAPTLLKSDLFDFLAPTGYFGGFSLADKNSIIASMDTSEQRWIDGLETTKYAYFDRDVNAAVRGEGSFTNQFGFTFLTGLWAQHKVISDAAGIGICQYEGGPGDITGTYNAMTAPQRTRLMEFYPNCVHTAAEAENYTLMYDLWTALGGLYPAQFVDMGAVSTVGAFGALRFVGDSNPRWDAVVRFNLNLPDEPEPDFDVQEEGLATNSDHAPVKHYAKLKNVEALSRIAPGPEPTPDILPRDFFDRVPKKKRRFTIADGFSDA